MFAIVITNILFIFTCFKKTVIKKIICLFSLLISCCPLYAITLYGHRGARGLSPENTLPAYRTALSIGVDYVDMDVVMTKDRVVVVQHNLSLNADITRNKSGYWIKDNTILIKNLTLNQLKQYDVGRINPNTKYAKLFAHQRPVDNTVIPTLKEAIQLVKAQASNRVGFQIEIKTDPANPHLTYTPDEIASAVEKIISEEGISKRTQVQAFDWRCLLALQKINPSIQTAYLTDKAQEKMMLSKDATVAGLMTAGKLLKDYQYSIPRMIHALGGKLWDPQDVEIRAEQIKEAHQLGLKVIAWSAPEDTGKVVDIVQIKKLIKMGVDGIITDRPDIVKKLL